MTPRTRRELRKPRNRKGSGGNGRLQNPEQNKHYRYSSIEHWRISPATYGKCGGEGGETTGELGTRCSLR
jgi:hypothetical protein